MEINAVKPDTVSKVNIKLASAGESVTIVPIGDVHYENVGCDLGAFRDTIKFVKDTPNCRAIVMGDVFDGIARGDKRYDDGVARDYKDETIWQDICYEVAREFMPIKDKIIGIHGGNHEKTVAKMCQVDLTQMLVDRLNEDMVPKDVKPAEAREMLCKISDGRIVGGVRNYRYCAITRLTAQRPKSNSTAQIDIWSHHGAGGGGTTGGALNKLEKAMDICDCDLFIMGHVHKEAASSRARLRLDQFMNLVVEHKKFLIAPSYLRSYEVGRRYDYAEAGMSNPAKIGHSVATWKPFGAHGYQSKTIQITIG